MAHRPANFFVVAKRSSAKRWGDVSSIVAHALENPYKNILIRNHGRSIFGAMTARRTWIDSLSDGFFEASLDRTLRRLIMVYRKRERMSARHFGEMALGDRGFISHRLKRGSSVGLKTADTVLAFMGEPLFGPWFRCEVETFIAITGSKAHWLGHYAVNDPSFVSRLRRGASPRLSTVDRVRAWMGANLRVAEQLAIRAAVARRDGSRAGANGQAHRTRLSGAAGERTMKDHPEYLSTLEAASLLGVSARTLERFRVSGGGPPFCKLGHRVSYTRSDVDGWAHSRRRRSTSDEGKD